jgi:hypothetical protein
VAVRYHRRRAEALLLLVAVAVAAMVKAARVAPAKALALVVVLNPALFTVARSATTCSRRWPWRYVDVENDRTALVAAAAVFKRGRAKIDAILLGVQWKLCQSWKCTSSNKKECFLLAWCCSDE